jgi:hypothetical protein
MFSRLTTTPARINVATIFGTITGLSLTMASNRLLGILLYIIVLIIFIPLHRHFLKSMKKIIEQLTREYDTLRYLVAKAQQKHPDAPQHSGTRAHQGIKILFDAPHPDYLHHYDIINNEVQSIEADLQTTIIDDAARKKISKLTAKRKNMTAFTDVL